MKSEFELFNKLRTPQPFKTFNPIRFDLGQRAPPISYSQASAISQQSVNYFRSLNINTNKVRARYHVENPVQFSAVSPKPYIELQQDITNSAEGRNSERMSVNFKTTGCYLRRGEYKKLISLASQDEIFYEDTLPTFCVFLAAILAKDDSTEFKLYQHIEELHYPYPAASLFLNEIHFLMSKENYPTPLLELTLGDVSLLREMLLFRPHLIANPNSRRFFRHRERMIGLTQLVNNHSNKLPQLIPVGDGYFGIPWKDPDSIFPIHLTTTQSLTTGSSGNNSAQSSSSKQKKSSGANSKNRSRTPIKSKESSDVLSFISQYQFDKAVQLASEALKKNPTDSEMYLHRAFALYHLEKIEDAINDCTLSLHIKKTDKALRMRASFWLLLGESTLFKEDIAAMDDKSLHQSINKVNNQNKNNQIGPNLMLGKPGKQTKIDQVIKRHTGTRKFFAKHLS